MFATAAIQTRNLERHRVPGVCVSLIGFILVFTGVMIMGINSTLKDSTSPDIRIAGPTCLTVGGLMVLGGFTSQYLLHKRYKAKLQQTLESRKRAIAGRSIPAISGRSGTAAKYVPDLCGRDLDGSVEASVPSTSAGMMPSITVETILEENEAYFSRRDPDISNNHFLDFSGRSFSFDDSSDDDCSTPRQTKTEAVIEHRKPCDGNNSNKGSPRSVNKTKAAPTSDEKRAAPAADMTIRNSRGIVHLASPSPVDGSPIIGESTSRRGTPPGSSDSSSGDSSIDKRSAYRSGSTRSLSNHRPGSKTHGKTRVSSARSRRPKGLNGNHDDGNHDDGSYNNEKAKNADSEDSYADATPTKNPPKTSGLLTTSWITSDADDAYSFVESLSRSSSFVGRQDLPGIEEPTELGGNSTPLDLQSLDDSHSLADSPPSLAESSSLADSPSLTDARVRADSDETIPNGSMYANAIVNNHVTADPEDEDDTARFQFAQVNGAAIPTDKGSRSPSPDRISADSSPKHVNGNRHDRDDLHPSKPAADWSENGDVTRSALARPRKGKGKMTKHSKCKNPRMENTAAYGGDPFITSYR